MHAAHACLAPYQLRPVDTVKLSSLNGQNMQEYESQVIFIFVFTRHKGHLLTCDAQLSQQMKCPQMNLTCRGSDIQTIHFFQYIARGGGTTKSAIKLLLCV
jgi:hypothetical protein